MKINALLLLVVVFIVTGCAAAPGMKMYEEGSIPDIPGVKVVPITADLIYQQEVGKTSAGPRTGDEGVWDFPDYEYRIGARDILSIVVWDHPELSISATDIGEEGGAGYLVNPDGNIFFPYVGMVQVAGKTITEVREIISRQLARKIVNPQLDVRVAAYRSKKVFVVGEVVTPGLQFLADTPMTVLGAINRAGGVTENADMGNVTINGRGETRKVDMLALYEQGDLTQNLVLDDGDILHVPDRQSQKVFVLGEVTRPSTLLMHKGRLTLTEAIGDVGGVDRETSNPQLIYVIRGTPNTPEIYRLNGKSPDALLLGDRFKLMPRDVVYVDTAGVARWNRFIQQILPTAVMLRNLDDTSFVVDPDRP